MSTAQIAQGGFFGLILEAGFMAKIVLLILLLASVVCWAIIFTKWRTLSRAARENTAFLNIFWHGKSIEEIFAKTDKFPRSSVAAVFKSGFVELKKLSGGEIRSMDTSGVENISRSLLRASSSEVA